MERLRPVTQPADEECQAEDKQQVGEDRADQGGLDDDDEAGPQREDRDEELRQVAERRLKDPGRRRPEALAELIGPLPDQDRQRGEGDRADDEDDRLAGADAVEDEGEDRGRDRDDPGRGPGDEPAGELEPEVVLMDVRMPGVDGIEARLCIGCRISSGERRMATSGGEPAPLSP